MFEGNPSPILINSFVDASKLKRSLDIVVNALHLCVEHGLEKQLGSLPSEWRVSCSQTTSSSDCRPFVRLLSRSLLEVRSVQLKLSLEQHKQLTVANGENRYHGVQLREPQTTLQVKVAGCQTLSIWACTVCAGSFSRSHITTG